MSNTAAIVLVLIFLVAAVLLVVPRLLGRRSRGVGPAPAARPVPAPPQVEPHVEPEAAPDADVAVGAEPPEVLEPPDRELLALGPAPRLRDRLGKTRSGFAGLFGSLRSGGAIGDAAYDDLEETLLLADVGLATTTQVLDGVRARVAGTGARDASELPGLVRAEIEAVFSPQNDRRALNLVDGQCNVWLLVGVNGVGKTTTCAKLAARAQGEGRRPLLAAADTFRAAAADQLGQWAERLGVDLVRGQDGGDPGAVVFDAMDAAASRGVDLVLVDTAGRLHTKVNLMKELEKLRRIVDRRPGALQEVLLVLDASTGQNGLVQAREFADAVAITGVVLTKLDGTAKGGVVLAIEHEFGVPVKLVGLGEAAEDLVEFDPAEFSAALVEHVESVE